ncbi:MAG: Smr/MutS family protein, partial [Gammaproteobacteria bacterium]|nr:Smr/MutS family protein [Gammaproteobacteria bacterium]
QIRVEAELDLHGFTVNEARVELTEFLHFAMESGLRCVRIIHGKGKSSQPILKQKVDYWLRQREEVLAFCSAINRDGGTGALYLLLRRIDRL